MAKKKKQSIATADSNGTSGQGTADQTASSSSSKTKSGGSKDNKQSNQKQSNQKQSDQKQSNQKASRKKNQLAGRENESSSSKENKDNRENNQDRDKSSEQHSEKKSKKAKKHKKLGKKAYKKELKRLQAELVKLQYWVKAKGLKVVVLFEGRDAAGKGGAIKRITGCLNPRICRTVALAAPNDEEKGQWYFQRYIEQLPTAGEIVLFDRSWYNRAGVERVMGFCTHQEYVEFLHSCPEFENMLKRAGIVLVKYWFSVSDEEQEKRFQERLNDPTKRWKLSPMDLEARARWFDYSKAKDDMFATTDTTRSPWNVVEADDKKRARLNCINHLLHQITYEDLTPPPMTLPPRQKRVDYKRPPMEMQDIVEDVI